VTSPFEKAFGTAPAVTATAPARANLLGEHTDYNDGFVLPTPLPYFTTVQIGLGPTPGQIDAYAARFDESLSRRIDVPKQGDWLDYVVGCFAQLAARGVEVPGLRIAVDSDVPMGAGISSSAALEVATLRAARDALNLELDDVELALMGQAAESQYVGMPCGIMDQMVSSLGTPGQALFLDTRTRQRKLLDLPAGYSVAVVHSGVSHQLTDGGYKQRLEECRTASKQLGVEWLRDLSPADLDRINALPEPLNRRARHVVTENQRVLDAVEALGRGDVATFGRLMVESHASQRDDYKVSVPAVDRLVESGLKHGAIGARLTGGGFGGSIVALVETGRLAEWQRAVTAECEGSRAL